MRRPRARYPVAAAAITSVLSLMLASLSEDGLIAVATHLDAAGLLRLALACKAFHKALLRSRYLWRRLSLDLLGEPLVQLHLSAWRAADSARFHRRLVRAALEGELAYANSLRSAVVGAAPAPLERIINTTGHTATACGALVAVIGGWRPSCLVEHLHVFVVDVAGRALRVPQLAEGSARPCRRMRHASAAVATPRWARVPAGAPALPSALVLGGACDGGGPGADPPPGEERGEPVAGGLLTLSLMSFCARDGSVVTWQEAAASGSAPASLWHHQCAAFRGGTRVVVFGGDMKDDDPEYAWIDDRGAAAHVYVLDVEACAWARVGCTGARPSWRSLHVGLAVRAVDGGGGSEGLLVLGGSDEHVAPFSSGSCADFKPYVLDLDAYEWRTAPEDHGVATELTADGRFHPPPPFEPRPRMRFAAEAYGNTALIYSGHGDAKIPSTERLLRLDLRTLRWSRTRVRNAPASLPDTPAACLVSGVLVGGVKFTHFGIRPCPKLDLLVFAEPPEDDGDVGGETAAAAAAGPSSGEAVGGAAARWEGAPRAPGEAAAAAGARAGRRRRRRARGHDGGGEHPSSRRLDAGGAAAVRPAEADARRRRQRRRGGRRGDGRRAVAGAPGAWR